MLIFCPYFIAFIVSSLHASTETLLSVLNILGARLTWKEQGMGTFATVTDMKICSKRLMI